MNDLDLIRRATEGDRRALEELLEQHRDWIFNVALSFIAHREDASDITQEVLIKIMTNLSTFRHESDFKTWVYRIVKNHFLNMKRRRYEMYSMTFDSFGSDLDEIPDQDFSAHQYEVEEKVIVEEAKLSCMKAMLLCLDREQRLIFILGELFEFPDSVGSEVMEISKENFRIKLHRARQQLYNFMNDKCGLINKANPCRCARKTASYIKLGFVDPVNRHFQRDAITTIDTIAPGNVDRYSNEVLVEYRTLFGQHPFIKAKEVIDSIRTLLSTEAIRNTFNL
jgi:RNA polymerase sigma factor (sigma-70 family)